MSIAYWKSYKNCMSAAKRSRKCAEYFARHGCWTNAFAQAATAKTAQAKADEHFERYLDALALDDVCDTSPDIEAYCGQGTDEPLLDQP